MIPSHLPIITEYLRSHPDGASAREIAEMLDCMPDSAARLMNTLERQGVVMRIADGARDGRWKLVVPVTPPIFRAAETLEAMQNAARNLALEAV